MVRFFDVLRWAPERLRANDPNPESFETKVRVLSLLCLCLLSLAPIIGGIFMAFDRPSSPLPTGYFVLEAATLIWPVTWWSVLCWGLVVGETFPKMMDVMIGGSLLAAFCAAFGSPEFDVTYLNMALFAGTSLIVGTSWWKLWYTLSHALGLLQAYNRFASHAGWTFASIDPYKREDMSMMTYAISTVGYFTAGVMLCATLLLQRSEHIRARDAARAAEEVTTTIASKLQVYDTAAAAAALQHDAAAGVDKELKVAFTALVANLESYRPYLPNWLLTSTDEEDGDEQYDDNNNNKESDSDGQSSTDCTSSSRFASSRPHLRSSSKKEEPGMIESYRKHSAPGTSEALQNTDSSFESSAKSGRSRTSEEPPRRHSGGCHDATATTRAAALEKKSYLKGTATFAVIEYSTEEVPDAALSTTLTAVADVVHQCAAESKGAVHTMLLGEIIVSWNVATRVPGPETKAAKFLLALQTALALSTEIDSSFKAVAVAATHHARSETIGTSKKLLTSERTGSLRQKLRGIFRFAWSNSAATTHSTPAVSTVPNATTSNETAHQKLGSPSLPPARRHSAAGSSPLCVILLDERTMREATSNFIISAGAVLDVSAHLPRKTVAPQDQRVGHHADGGPDQSGDIHDTNISHESLLPELAAHSVTSEVPLPSSRSDNVAVQERPRQSLPLPGVDALPTITATSGTAVSATTAACKITRRESHRTRSHHHSVVHVFDLVSARSGGDDEWLYAMEDGAADAARAAQLLMSPGLQRQNVHSIDTAAVRAAFEEARKQRDGPSIMARPLVKQLIEDIAAVPTKA